MPKTPIVRLSLTPFEKKTDLPVEIVQQLAAIKLQRFYRRLACRNLVHPKLERSLLIQRLRLEKVVLHGLNVMLLYTSMFMLLCIAIWTMHSSRTWNSHRILYENVFSLSDTSSLVRVEDVLEQLSHMSSASRSFQHTSSDVYVEKAQVKLIKGIRTFQEAQSRVNLKLMVDVRQFSLASWVKVPGRRQAQRIGIVHKPFKSSYPVSPQRPLYCWGWFYEANQRFLQFGAHDYGYRNYSQEVAKVDIDEDSNTNIRTTVGSLNLEVVVVNETAASFWQNGHVIGTVPLQRPVTDCSVSDIIVASSLTPGLPTVELGELSYFPEALSREDMLEMVAYGAALKDIAFGRLLHLDEITRFDDLHKLNQDLFSQRTHETGTTIQSIEEKHTLTRQAMSRNKSVSQVPDASLPTTSCSSNKPDSCDVITGVNTTRQKDGTSEHYFYDLLPHTQKSKVRLPTRFITTWDPDTFPTWLDKSVSLTWWFRSIGPLTGWLIMKHSDWDADRSKRCYGVWLQRQGLRLARRDKYTSLFFSNSVLQSKDYSIENSDILRHLALVYNSTSRELHAYMDGTLFAQQKNVSDFNDCRPEPRNWIGFGTRYPGNWRLLESEIRDFRMYPGVALSKVEIARIAAPGRECRHGTFMQDSSVWKDKAGKSCAWYQSASQSTPSICQGHEVRKQCPVACIRGSLCLQSTNLRDHGHFEQAWKRIMHLKPNQSSGQLCLATGVNPLRECLSPTSTLGRQSLGEDAASTQGAKKNNVTNCTLIATAVDDLCQFAPLRQVAQRIAHNKEFTVSFWIKDPLSRHDFRPSLQLFSSMAPLFPLVKLVWNTDSVAGHVWNFCNNTVFVENLFVTGIPAVPIGQWSMITFMSGRSIDSSGLDKIAIAFNSKISFIANGRQHCPPPSGDILQGITISDEILISPIEVYPFGMTPNEVQKMYYKERHAMNSRTGPLRSDRERLATKFPVEKNVFANPATLLAPPIIKTKRYSSTQTCPTIFAQNLTQSILPNQVATGICSAPYTCERQSDILACRSEKMPDEFLGMAPSNGYFIEFLYTIVEVDNVIRGTSSMKNVDTSTFIDSLTKEIHVIIILFDPSEGLATRVSLSVDFAYGGAEAHHEIQHCESIEGRRLSMTICFAVLQVLVCALNIPTMMRNYTIFKNRALLVLDVLVTASVLATTCLHLYSVLNSRFRTDRILSNIVGVPWAAEGVDMSHKKRLFFEADRAMTRHFQFENTLENVRYVQLLVLLFRVLIATRTHPRIAILVWTIVAVADDLFHFLIVFSIMYAGFCVITWVKFGPDRYEFSDFGKTFVSQFEMIHGELPDYSQNFTFFAYVVLFNTLVFLLMMNFLLALVVDGLAKVRKQINDDVTEQAWLLDLVFSIYTDLIKARWWKWPKGEAIADALQDQNAKHTVSIIELHAAYPDWNTKSIVAFLHHYGHNFPCLWPPKSRPAVFGTLTNAVEELEDYISFALNRSRKNHIVREFERKKKPVSESIIMMSPGCQDAPYSVQESATACVVTKDKGTLFNGNTVSSDAALCDEAKRYCDETAFEHSTEACEYQIQNILSQAQRLWECAQEERAAAAAYYAQADAAWEEAQQEQTRTADIVKRAGEERELVSEIRQSTEDAWKHARDIREEINQERTRAEGIWGEIRQERMLLCGGWVPREAAIPAT